MRDMMRVQWEGGRTSMGIIPKRLASDSAHPPPSFKVNAVLMSRGIARKVIVMSNLSFWPAARYERESMISETRSEWCVNMSVSVCFCVRVSELKVEGPK